jgi:hypothetical protein
MSMVLKISFALGFGALLFLACGSSQGDSCTSDKDCGSNLACQTIRGRTQNYCCPTPPEASDYQNCHGIANAPAPTPTPSPGPADAGGG